MLHAWLAPAVQRCYPASPPESGARLTLSAARGQRVAAQVAVRTAERASLVEVAADTPEGVEARIRTVGHVPLRHFTTGVPREHLDGVGYLPGMVPDPLFEGSQLELGPYETRSFWLTLRVAADAPACRHELRVHVRGAESDIELTVELQVYGFDAPTRTGFPITQWLHADAICDWYRCAPSDDRFWQLLGSYLHDYTSHHCDMIYVPLWTPPLDGDRRPLQLLGVDRERDGHYRFDWSRVRRWVALCRASGITGFEWTHLYSQWGAKHPPRIYLGHGETEEALWPATEPGTGPAYREFLSEWLPQFDRFLAVEDLHDRSVFHLSDEPSGDAAVAAYGQARAQVAQFAPWLGVCDALSDIRLARQQLVDEPIALLPEVPAFVAEGFPAWAYFCCLPRGAYLNRLLDTPLITVAMTGWLLHRMQVRGFLHWGYNYWYRGQTRELIDPFATTDGDAWPKWPGGDPYQVYPGPDGPIDSIRWEVFAESLQDLALLRAAEIPPDSPLLGDLKDFADFPRSVRWLDDARTQLLAQA